MYIALGFDPSYVSEMCRNM